MFEKLICFLARFNCHKINPIEYDKLLRFPGQSSEEKIDEIIDNMHQKLFTITITYGLIALYIPWIGIFYIFITIALVQKTLKDITPYKLGRDGEKAMSQYLYSIARESSDMYIFNDIVNSEKKYNIDHIVLTKNGIFLIDTKTYSKEKGKKNQIIIKNNKLFKNDYHIKLPAIDGQAKWLLTHIKKEIKKDISITPIIAYIGWYVEGSKIDNIYITNAKNIKNILKNSYSTKLFDDSELQKIKKVLTSLSTNHNRKANLCCD